MQARTQRGYDTHTTRQSGQVGWLAASCLSHPNTRSAAIQERAVRGRCHGLITYCYYQLTPAEIQSSSLAVAIDNHPDEGLCLPGSIIACLVSL